MTNDLNDHLVVIALPVSCCIKTTCVARKNILRGEEKILAVSKRTA